MNKSARCPWCGDDPLYIEYHDKEWGKPVYDDHKLFEFLVLESAQAGLAWITVLRKREGYRKAFHNFDFNKVAIMSDNEVEQLISNPDIIRNRSKIAATISNARLLVKIIEEYGSFYNYIIRFLPSGKRIVNHYGSFNQVPAHSEVSDALSRDMKKRGFKYCGTTICYSFLQATGFIDDHLNQCPYKRY